MPEPSWGEVKETIKEAVVPVGVCALVGTLITAAELGAEQALGVDSPWYVKVGIIGSLSLGFGMAIARRI
jgi:hypothetical protein